MTSDPDRLAAASVVKAALIAVFDAGPVSVVREDSPLTALGLTPADMACVADAVARETASWPAPCVLDDADLADVTTVADLVDAVVSRRAAGSATS